MSEPLRFWLLILAIGAATFSLRYAFFFIFGRYAVPQWIRTILPFIPAAALSALVAPKVVELPLAPDLFAQPRFLAWLAAMAVAWRTRNIFLTIACGMVLLWVVEWVLG